MVVATLVALSAAIPAMVVGDVAAITFPTTSVVLAADMIRLNPVRALIRRTGPVAVVLSVAPTLRIVVTLDPDIVGAGPWSDAVRPRSGWLANVDAE